MEASNWKMPSFAFIFFQTRNISTLSVRNCKKFEKVCSNSFSTLWFNLIRNDPCKIFLLDGTCLWTPKTWSSSNAVSCCYNSLDVWQHRWDAVSLEVFTWTIRSLVFLAGCWENSPIGDKSTLIMQKKYVFPTAKLPWERGKTDDRIPTSEKKRKHEKIQALFLDLRKKTLEEFTETTWKLASASIKGKGFCWSRLSCKRKFVQGGPLLVVSRVSSPL